MPLRALNFRLGLELRFCLAVTVDYVELVFWITTWNLWSVPYEWLASCFQTAC